MAIRGSSPVGGGNAQIIAQAQARSVQQQQPQVQATSPADKAGSAQFAKQKKDAVQNKAQQLKDAQATKSLKNKRAKKNSLKRQTQTVPQTKINNNGKKLDKSMSSPSMSGEAAKCIGELVASAAQSGSALVTAAAPQKGTDSVEDFTEKQEDIRENIDTYSSDLIDIAGDGFEKAGEAIGEAIKSRAGKAPQMGAMGPQHTLKELETSKDSFEGLKEFSDTTGRVAAGAKALVTAKHLYDNPTAKGAIELGSALADAYDDESLKAVGTLAGAAHEIYSKSAEGKLTSAVVVDQLSEVTEQVANTVEAIAEGKSMVTVEGLSWAASYMPDTGLTSMVTEAASTVDQATGASSWSSWCPGLGSVTAGYQLYCDGHALVTGKDSDGKDIGGYKAAAKTACSTVKLAASFAPGAGKLFGVGADLVRWSIG